MRAERARSALIASCPVILPAHSTRSLPNPSPPRVVGVPEFLTPAIPDCHKPETAGVILSDGVNPEMNDGTEAVQTTDTLLLKGLRSGEKEAFEPLFARHWQRMYGVLFRLVGTREEAEDLAQEAFLRLYRNPPASTATRT